MTTREYLEEELKRLNRRNDLLEKEANKSIVANVLVEDAIQKNTLAMCEIARILWLLTIYKDY